MRPDIAPESAGGAAQRLRRAVVDQPIEISPGQAGREAGVIRQTISVGFAIGGADGVDEDLGQLLDRADRALYASKAQGRNCITFGQREPKVA